MGVGQELTITTMMSAISSSRPVTTLKPVSAVSMCYPILKNKSHGLAKLGMMPVTKQGLLMF